MNATCDIPGAALAVDRAAFPDPAFDPAPPAEAGAQTAVLAAGCFWCVEAVFQQLDGVEKVISGYSGGRPADANYDRVSMGTTDHAEAISICFDPAKITYGQLLKVFFAVAHDPTQVNGQGNDRGRQYRSAIFYADAAQREVAEKYIGQLDAAHVFSAPIATELLPLDAFHDGEAYHQNYARQHPDQGYIAAVAMPKVAKLHKQFGAMLKVDNAASKP